MQKTLRHFQNSVMPWIGGEPAEESISGPRRGHREDGMQLSRQTEQPTTEAEQPAQPKGHGTWRSTDHRIQEPVDTRVENSNSRQMVGNEPALRSDPSRKRNGWKIRVRGQYAPPRSYCQIWELRAQSGTDPHTQALHIPRGQGQLEAQSI